MCSEFDKTIKEQTVLLPLHTTVHGTEAIGRFPNQQIGTCTRARKRKESSCTTWLQRNESIPGSACFFRPLDQFSPSDFFHRSFLIQFGFSRLLSSSHLTQLHSSRFGISRPSFLTVFEFSRLFSHAIHQPPVPISRISLQKQFQKS